MMDLSLFSSRDFDKGAGKLKITLWYFVNALVVRAAWNPFMGIKIMLLRLFGARIGKGMVIKTEVRIKSPWNLVCGDNVWLGERCWIDNLDKVTIGNNVCISQDALIITGNHDYKKRDFCYRNAPVTIDDGVWICARATVSSGVHVYHDAMLSMGSIATTDLEAGYIYKGSPAQICRKRIFEEDGE